MATWRRHERNILQRRKMERPEISLYIAYMAQEGLYECATQSKADAFYNGANQAYAKIMRMYAIDEILLYIYNTHRQLEAHGARVEYNRICVPVKQHTIGGDIVPDKTIILLIGQLCASVCVHAVASEYKQRIMK